MIFQDLPRTRSPLPHRRRAANIQATGLTEVTRATSCPVFGEDIGRNIFFVPLSQRRKQLEKIPWVEHATVMRLLPDQIRVSGGGDAARGVCAPGQQIGLVDANGVLLSMSPARHDQASLLVSGGDGH